MGYEVELDVETKVEVSKPSNYAVVFVNDDYTPMEFVSEILMAIFNKNEFDAGVITQDIHEFGEGIAGVYKFEIAETKAYQTMEMARDNDFPLTAKVREL
jgi:ATP-dependent Clp protease adaptor protein ClpS